VIIEAVEEIAYSMLRTQRSYSSPQFAINVKEVRGRKLIHPVLSLMARGNSPGITITAQEAELRSDREQNVLKIILRNGTADVEGEVTYSFADVEEREIPLSDASRAKKLSDLPSWLPLRAIPERIVAQKEAIQRYEQELAAQAGYDMLTGDFHALTGDKWTTRRNERQDLYNYLHRLYTEPHRRWSAGFSCLCFVWVGAPMAIWLRNRDFLTSFFLCFLPILVVYYPLLVYGVDGAKNGTIPAFSVWAGNAILLLWGAYLLRKVLRY
jgi:lipopolysaccharide export system permease protein